MLMGIGRVGILVPRVRTSNELFMSFAGLRELNAAVELTILEGDFEKQFCDTYKIIVFTETPLSDLLELNAELRNRVKMVVCETHGLAGLVAVDAGQEEWKYLDDTGMVAPRMEIISVFEDVPTQAKGSTEPVVVEKNVAIIKVAIDLDQVAAKKNDVFKFERLGENNWLEGQQGTVLGVEYKKQAFVTLKVNVTNPALREKSDLSQITSDAFLSKVVLQKGVTHVSPPTPSSSAEQHKKQPCP